MAELLCLESVSKSFSHGAHVQPVLRDVSLRLGGGQSAAVVGERFAGKTTLLRIAAGIERPSAGDVLFEGRNLRQLASRARGRLLGDAIAWCDRGEPGMDLLVRDLVALSLLMGRSENRRQALGRADVALESLGALRCARKRWVELSTWERMLVSLARGVVCEPRLLVVDDLLDGFGGLRSIDAAHLLRELSARVGCAVLLGTSDREASVLAEKVYALQDGRLRLTVDVSMVANGTVVPFPEPRRQRGGVGV
jgi:predicted ABC-type transport system involved in lysophospholipase L1 biosynthesis ATPase subunit